QCRICWSAASINASRAAVLFFFQAEDGIRDKLVTGVQTCALPILPVVYLVGRPRQWRHGVRIGHADDSTPRRSARFDEDGLGLQIGRASCRERGEIPERAGSMKKKSSSDSTRCRRGGESSRTSGDK